MAIVLALGASLTWGLADFFGPLQGRSLGALRTLFYVEIGGLVAIAIVVAARGNGPAHAAAFFAVPAGVSGTLGLYAYYRGAAAGAMSVVAPIAGISAVVPVIFGIASGDHPSAWELDLSTDDASYTAVARGVGDDLTKMVFPTRSARYVRIRQIGSGYDHWWSINELTVYQ